MSNKTLPVSFMVVMVVVFGPWCSISVVSCRWAVVLGVGGRWSGGWSWSVVLGVGGPLSGLWSWSVDGRCSMFVAGVVARKFVRCG